MKRLITTVALSAFLVALAAPLALAAANPAPAKSGSETHMKAMNASTEHKTGKMEATHREMMDLNSATKDELMKLPGMTEATVEKIIADRPYKSRMELLRKNIVTKEEYAKIRTEVTAKQAGGEKKGWSEKKSWGGKKAGYEKKAETGTK